ncbi:hypothetical protein E4T56_gene17439 [Termitomyces sp. T112]|nr:hypothetical protein E4T56_gene17439 [Termitomyces sp. T112]
MSKRRYLRLQYIVCTRLRSHRPSESSKEEVKVCADGEGDAAGEYAEDNIGKVWEPQIPRPRHHPQPPQCSAKLPNPCPPSAPTSGNSNTSSANSNGSLINSDAFSTAVDASPQFPWTPKAFPDPRAIRFPTDPIRMSLRPAPRSHPTTVDSAQFRQARCHILYPPEPPSSSFLCLVFCLIPVSVFGFKSISVLCLISPHLHLVSTVYSSFVFLSSLHLQQRYELRAHATTQTFLRQPQTSLPLGPGTPHVLVISRQTPAPPPSTVKPPLAPHSICAPTNLLWHPSRFNDQYTWS